MTTHQHRVNAICRYYARAQNISFSPTMYLTVKFDLLELCERLAQLHPSKVQRLNVVRNGLLHHDTEVDIYLKFETYIRLLHQFSQQNANIDLDLSTGLLASFDAEDIVWKAEKQSGNHTISTFPQDQQYILERCEQIRDFYQIYETLLVEQKNPSEPRKSMLMNIIEIGVLFSDMIIDHQPVSKIMPMEQVILFTEFRKSFCHVNTPVNIKDAQHALEKIVQISTALTECSSLSVRLK